MNSNIDSKFSSEMYAGYRIWAKSEVHKYRYHFISNAKVSIRILKRKILQTRRLEENVEVTWPGKIQAD